MERPEMVTDLIDTTPEIDAQGAILFRDADALRRALPRLKRGALTCLGAPAAGTTSFQITVGGTQLTASVGGRVVSAVGGRALILLSGVPEPFLAAAAALPTDGPPPEPAPAPSPPPPPPPPSSESVRPTPFTPTFSAVFSLEPGLTDAAPSPAPVAPPSPAPAPPPAPDVVEAAVALPGLARQATPPAPPPEEAIALPGGSSRRVSGAPTTYVGRARHSLEVVGGELPAVAPSVRERAPATDLAAEFTADLPDEDPARIKSIPANSPLLSGVAVSASGAMPFFLLVSHLRATGCLVFTKGAVTKIATFVRGRMVELRSNDPTELLGELVIGSGFAGPEQVAAAVEQSREQGMFLGIALVRQGILLDAELRQVLQQQFRARLADLLSWRHGTARFDPGAAVPSKPRTLPQTTLGICRELTTTDRGISAERVRDWLGAESRLAPVEFGRWLVDPSELDPAEVQLMQQLRPDETVANAMVRLADGGRTESQLAHSLFVLACAACVRVVRPVPAVAPAPAPAQKPEALVELENRLEEHDLFRMLGLHVNTPSQKLLDAIDQVMGMVLELTEALPATDDTRSRLTERVGALHRRVCDPLELRIMQRAHLMGVNPTDPSAHAILESQCIGDMVSGMIAKGQHADALPYAERSLTLRPEDPRTIAAVHLARALSSSDEAVRTKALADLRAAAQRFPNALDVQLALGEVGHAMGKRADARNALAAAEGIAPRDPRVVRLQSLMARSTTGEVAARKSTSSAPRVAMPSELAGVVLLTAGTLGALGVAAHTLGLGKGEMAYDGADKFFFVRRGMLILMALMGALVVRREGPLTFLGRIGWMAPPAAFGIALLVGLGSGSASAAQAVTGSAGLVMGLTIFHVLAEEIFFTWFLARTLGELIEKRAAIIVTAFTFGLYHLTSHQLWAGFGAQWIPFQVLMISVGGGLPYAMLAIRSGGVLPSLVCHLAVNLTMMGASLAERSAGGAGPGM